MEKKLRIKEALIAIYLLTDWRAIYLFGMWFGKGVISPKTEKGKKKKVINNNTDGDCSDNFDLFDDRIVASKFLKKTNKFNC